MRECNTLLLMKHEQDVLRKMFPNASRSVIARNPHLTQAGLSHPQPKPIIRHDSLGKAKGKEKSHGSGPGGTHRVTITSHRARAVDPDNLAGGSKYLIDALRVCGLITDDSPEHIELVVRQEKVAHRSGEYTSVEIAPTEPRFKKPTEATPDR